jgi:hypothetical protein
MNTMTLTVERTPRSLMLDGNTLQVEELSVTLPFARKPCDLSELGGGKPEKVLVTDTREMSITEFDEFASNLLRSRPWLSGKGGSNAMGNFCVEVFAPGRPYLYINPEGGDYARYVARLG